ncbi:penicillin-binding protein [Prauserella marina]|uniref:CubicO group peptidase, beta-lactamase class C family n=1 Tax=Prauserella marina TaxID=530584 RepID=A0A222VP55_9PSEU|nr:serine hydrolase domain-containing protein [Prauserella marina]ASR35664.1 penicillin-binding protein [Prauserella marina]PWV84461.1 CubicO group peptidase (beta-lactamase class C family) [Prauserella marina]SDC21969.1 CubicO group peptidase, beta-lactamase class C family [Prauserella marina]
MPVTGTTLPGFERVRDVFEDVVAGSRGGAGFSVVRRGEVLVDLWGGLADPERGKPWREDTLCVLFSGTKGVVAAAVAALGVLDPDVEVCQYWPGFTEGVLVHHVLDHTAGLPYVDGAHDLLDSRTCADLLARQDPLWTPGSRVAYHALTYGYLVDELLRRTTGKSAGELVAEVLAGPHELDLHLGTPAALDQRVALLRRAPDYRISTFLDDPDRRRIVERMYSGLLDSDELINSVRYRRAGLAAGGATGTARAMATLYALLADDRIGSPDALARATRTWSRGTDVINDRPVHFGLGFELADSIGTYGPAANAFGHSGAGGGRNGAWPDAGIGFSFVSNEMRAENADGRADRLLAAVHEAL